MSKRHREDVAVGGKGRVDWRDRRHAVGYAAVVDQRRIEGVGQGEAAKRPTMRVVRGRRPAGDVSAADEQHEDEVRPVSMHTFGCGMPWRTGLGFDAELMDFDVPPARSRGQGIEELPAEAEDRQQARALADRIDDRCEPPFDAAEELVVFRTLVVRLVRFTREAAIGGGRIDSVPS